MRVIVGAEARFSRAPDGTTWTPVQYGRRFWDRYLKVFDEVRVLSRVKEVPEPPEGWLRVDGDGVIVHALPYYEGPLNFLLCSRQFAQAVNSSLELDAALIFRVGSEIARIAKSTLKRTGRPYAVEVLSDPVEVFAPGSVSHPLRPFFQRYCAWQLRNVCEGAAAASYVTEFALQRRYPAGRTAYSTYYSDVELPPQAFVRAPKVASREISTLNLISVGSLAQMYKSPDVVIDAIAALVQEGHDVRLTWIGDGIYRPAMEARAQELGLSNRVNFLGSLPPGDPVRDQLDIADLFLLVSRAESLGRALIEAMARGLPCIGSTVGGIPELLPNQDLVPPADVKALTEKIRAVAASPARMTAMAERNLFKAREYRAEALAERQTAFLRTVRDQAVEWQAWQRRQPVSQPLPL